MTSTTTEAPSSGPPAPSPATSSQASGVESLCLQLGWSMQRLYRATPATERARTQLPDRLPGLGRLSRLRRVRIDFGRAQGCLSGVAAALQWAAAGTPDVGPVQECLEAFEPTKDAAGQPAVSEAVTHYREAVLDLHLALITKITAAGANLGKAYNLGRALADTSRPNQQSEDLQDGFEPYRLAQLKQDLDDLASVLPPHAGKAVAKSMTWWRDAVYLADDSPTGRHNRRTLNEIRTDAPELRRPRGLLNPKITQSSTSGDLGSLSAALPRQGELWRVVLTGEKKPLDLLTPDDYLDAAQRAVAKSRPIAARAVLAAPKTTISIFLLVTAVLAGVLLVIEQSNTSGGGKLAAFLVAVGGYLGSLARGAMPRLRSAARQVEGPLWESALDYVSAEAISVPPVGHPDSSGWSLPASRPAPAPSPATSAPNAP